MSQGPPSTVQAEVRKLAKRVERLTRELRKEADARRALEQHLANLAPGETYPGGSAR